MAWGNLITRAYPILDLPFVHGNFIVGTVVSGSGAAGDGLRTGDRIDLQNVPLQGRLKLLHRVGRWTIINLRLPGELVHFTVQRTGSRVPIVARSSLIPANVPLVLIKRIAGTISVLVAALLVLFRPTRMLWGFYLFILGETAPTPFVFNLLPATTNVILSDAFNALVSSLFFCAGLLVFVARFPGDAAEGWRRRLERSAIPIALVFGLVTVGDDILWQNAIPHPDSLDFLSAAVGPAVIALAFVFLVTRFARLGAENRQRLKWVVAGICVYLLARAYISVAPAYWRVGLSGWLHGGWPLAWTNVGFTVDVLNAIEIIIPLTVGYAVLRHRVLDISFVISRALVYGTLTSLIVVIFALIDWFFVRKLVATNVGLIAEIITAIGLGFWLDSLHNRIDILIDRVFFKHRYRAELTLARIATALPHATSASAVDDLLVSQPVGALDLASAALFTRAVDGSYTRGKSIGWPDDSTGRLGPDDAIVLHVRSHLQAFRVSEIHWRRDDLPSAAAYPALALSVVVRNEVGAIAFYGAHKNGTDLDPNENHIISRLAPAAGAAYDHLEAQAWRSDVESLRNEVEALRARLAGAQIQPA